MTDDFWFGPIDGQRTTDHLERHQHENPIFSFGVNFVNHIRFGPTENAAAAGSGAAFEFAEDHGEKTLKRANCRVGPSAKRTKTYSDSDFSLRHYVYRSSRSSGNRPDCRRSCQ